MTIRLALVLASIATLACTSSPEASATEQPRAKPAADPAPVLRFTRDDNGRRQSLEVRKKAGGEIEVAIAAAGTCARNETGVAKPVKDSGDVDIEMDPDGEGHPTDAFTFATRDKCQIAIRLAAPDRRFAWVRESGCSSSCPLSDEPMVKK
jgi:hypothetical protein